MSYVAGVWVPDTGELAELHTEPAYRDVVTIRAMIDGKRRAHIEFKSGAQLTVPAHILKEHRPRPPVPATGPRVERMKHPNHRTPPS